MSIPLSRISFAAPKNTKTDSALVQIWCILGLLQMLTIEKGLKKKLKAQGFLIFNCSKRLTLHLT